MMVRGMLPEAQPPVESLAAAVEVQAPLVVASRAAASAVLFVGSGPAQSPVSGTGHCLAPAMQPSRARDDSNSHEPGQVRDNCRPHEYKVRERTRL